MASAVLKVEALVQGIESGLKDEVEELYRVDLVSIGGAPAQQSAGGR
jgi:hypothetical protein